LRAWKWREFSTGNIKSLSYIIQWISTTTSSHIQTITRVSCYENVCMKRILYFSYTRENRAGRSRT
jgi:hypothetical protein